MRRIGRTLLLLALLLAPALAVAQSNVRVRGTITAIDAGVMTVKSRDGQDLTLKLADDLGIVAAKAMTLADLKPGDYVGVTAVRGADGAPVAREVHTIARTVPEGHGPWDLEPGLRLEMTGAHEASARSARMRLCVHILELESISCVEQRLLRVARPSRSPI